MLWARARCGEEVTRAFVVANGNVEVTKMEQWIDREDLDGLGGSGIFYLQHTKQDVREHIHGMTPFSKGKWAKNKAKKWVLGTQHGTRLHSTAQDLRFDTPPPLVPRTHSRHPP